MLIVNSISKSYPKSKKWFVNQYEKVLHPTSFHLHSGHSMGVIGESGSGKSTLARLILGLEKPDSGTITFSSNSSKKDLKITENNLSYLTNISAVFQDYVSSLNPFMQVHEIMLEPSIIHEKNLTNKTKKVNDLLDMVGLPRSIYFKYPHELSGGQQQRLCIARSLSAYPKFIVLDEPTSSLDMMSQLKILDLLKELKETFQLTYLFISHDIQAVTYLCDEVIFLHQGRLTEQIEVSKIGQAKSEYAKTLLSFFV